MAGIITFLLYLFLNCSSAASRLITAPAEVPQNASDVVSHTFQSWACAVHSWPDYAGNRSNPNLFSQGLIEIIAEKTGSPPHFRVGGTSGDRTTFVSNQSVAIRYDTLPGTQIPENVTIGPAFFQAFDTFESLGTQYIWMVNLVSKNLENAIHEARHGIATVGSNLEALEIGNEVDLYVQQEVRPPSWRESDYVREWLSFSDAITRRVLEGNDFGINPNHIWQAPVLANAQGEDGFTVAKAFREGIDRHSNIKSVSIHHYMTGYSPETTLQASFMNHTAIVANVSTWLPPREWLTKHKPGIPLYIAEANSDYVTNTLPLTYALQGVFGDALWKVDILMYAMSQSIPRYYVQQGTGFAFDSWQPVYINETAPKVLPPWYGDVFIADVIGTASSVQVLNIDLDNDLLSAYAVYNSQTLTKYVVVNLEEWNTTTPYKRTSQTITLHVPKSTQSATLSYLTAPGANSTMGISWAGQSWGYATTGGVEVLGSLNKGTVKPGSGKVEVALYASEAVLVTLESSEMLEQGS